MHPKCLFWVHFLEKKHPKSTQNAPKMHFVSTLLRKTGPTCTHLVHFWSKMHPKMYHEGTFFKKNAPKMHPKCTQNAPKVYPNIFKYDDGQQFSEPEQATHGSFSGIMSCFVGFFWVQKLHIEGLSRSFATKEPQPTLPHSNPPKPYQ